MEGSRKVIRISVVIPSFQGRRKIGKTLTSLLCQTRKPDEVIVVIDGSTDGSLEYLQTMDSGVNLIIHYQPNSGRSGARNAGARLATGDLLVFIDDDIQLVDQCLEVHERFHLSLSGGIATGNLVDTFDETGSDFHGYRAALGKKWMSRLSGEKALDKSSLFLSAANCSIRRTDFLKLGGFDERLSDAEDFDLATRAHSKGYSIHFLNLAVGYHYDPVNIGGYIKRLRQYRAAHLELKNVNPIASIYFNFEVYEISRVSVKGFIYWIFSSRIWLHLIERGLLKFLPAAIRFRIYDFVTTSWYLYFPDKPLT